MDSLDVVAVAMALEEAQAEAESDDEFAVYSEIVFRALLGPHAKHITWSADTIWSRSVAAIIRARAAHQGGCRCRT